MAHDWFDPRTTVYDLMMGEEERECHNCGAKQTLIITQLWGRVSRGTRRWEPLVGRCKPGKKTTKTG